MRILLAGMPASVQVSIADCMLALGCRLPEQSSRRGAFGPGVDEAVRGKE